MGLMRIKFSMEMTSAGQAKLIVIGGREEQRGARAILATRPAGLSLTQEGF